MSTHKICFCNWKMRMIHLRQIKTDLFSAKNLIENNIQLKTGFKNVPKKNIKISSINTQPCIFLFPLYTTEEHEGILHRVVNIMWDASREKVPSNMPRMPTVRSSCACEKYYSGLIITKTRLYNVDPLKPHFYTVKLGFTGVYIIFSYFCPKT